ncbi:MAG: rod shape determining protein RodA [Saprospiraceae bacterium]
MKNKLYWLIGFSILLAITIFVSSRGYFRPVFITNVVLFMVFAGYTWLEKKRALITRLIIFLFLGGILTASSNFAFNNILQPHQQTRINAWLQPSKTAPLYNVIQSKLAIGSGGFYGKGYLNGTMTLLDYVPEQSTDFIFCTIGEEQGFVGSVGIIGIIFLLIYRIVVLAERQRSEFSRNYAYAIAGILFVHCFVNIGMTLGLLPVVGIPLPFISYGGSSILSFSLMIGVLLKLDSQRYTV